MASTFNCRGCRVSLGSQVVPEFMGIGSLFGDEEANNTTDSLFCAKCKKSHANSSMKVHDCGHHNILNKFQRVSEDLCFFPECHNTKSRAQTEDDDCVFCSEILASATCVSFRCGHLFHETCITTHVRNMLSPTSGRVTITNSFCPLCKEPLNWNGEYSDIQRTMMDVTAIRDHLKSLCAAQIKKENGEKDGLPSDILEYGMKKYNFYQCKKCKSIYCGGKRECGEEEPEGENIYLCGGCRGCPKHGDEYMAYKCRYCCNEALYFCFGHTHYCDYCHSHNLRATGTNHQYMSSEPPACEGRHKCPLKIDHPPHGEEFALRCTACADEVQDEFGSDIENLYKVFYKEKPDLVVDALAKNRIANLFLERAPVAIARAAEDEIEGFWNLRALVGEEEEEEEEGLFGGLFGEEEKEEEEEEGLFGGLFGEEEEKEEEEREGEGERWEEWEQLQPMFGDLEAREEEKEGERQIPGPNGPTSDGPTVLPTTPSSPLLKLFSFSKLMYLNLPRLAIVAATATFLHPCASYIMV